MSAAKTSLRKLCIDLVKLVKESAYDDEVLADVLMSRFMDYIEIRSNEVSSTNSRIGINIGEPIQPQVDELVPKHVRDACFDETGESFYDMVLDSVPKADHYRLAQVDRDYLASRGKVATTSNGNVIKPTAWDTTTDDTTKH